MFELLLKKGADPNRMTNDKESIMARLINVHRARPDPKIVKLLLQYGFDFTKESESVL